MALYMRPWVIEAKGLGLIPRNLADDMMLAAKGRRADARLKQGMGST